MKRAAIFSILFSLALANAETFTLDTRDRVRDADGDWAVRQQKVLWDAKATAVIVCDMWDLHHCKNAVGRVGEMAPRMNQLLNTARARGALIIHAPSSCMEFYKNHPARKRAQAAPGAAVQPKAIESWCHWIDKVEESQGYPIDHSDGGEDDDPAEHAAWAKHLAKLGRNPGSPWKRQVDLIEIDPKRDAISDSGIEIWNLLEARGIRNVLLVGVHTNMCVLGRPFGLRNMARNGKNVLLVRDLTDSMYNPASWPYVNHFRGTSLVVEHIEQRVCPTTTSDQLLGGEPFRFKGDTPPHVVFMIGESEYNTASTLPMFAKKQLEYRGIRCSFVHVNQNDPNDFAGLEALKDADLLFLSVRRRTPPKAQLDLVRAHLAKGKPLVGIRTASHAFDREPPSENHARWAKFDDEILGVDYRNHYGNKPPKDPATIIQATAAQELTTPSSPPYRTMPSRQNRTSTKTNRSPPPSSRCLWLARSRDGTKSASRWRGRTRPTVAASFTHRLAAWMTLDCRHFSDCCSTASSGRSTSRCRQPTRESSPENNPSHGQRNRTHPAAGIEGVPCR